MEIIQFLQYYSNPVLDKIFVFITLFGEELFFILFLTIFYWCINKSLSLKLGLALFLSMCINNSIKEIFNVSRPIGLDGITSLRTETATGSSFPSGHTQATATFWSSISLHFRKTWLYVFSTIIILGVALSRLYLGVHWPTDVIGGIIIGILCVLLCNYLFDKCSKSNNFFIFILINTLFVIGLLFFNSQDYIKACGAFTGFTLGTIVEKKYINFNPKAELYKQILKFVLGVGVLILIKAGLKAIFPTHWIFNYIRYFFIGFWAIAGAPFVFEKLNLK